MSQPVPEVGPCVCVSVLFPHRHRKQDAAREPKRCQVKHFCETTSPNSLANSSVTVPRRCRRCGMWKGVVECKVWRVKTVQCWVGTVPCKVRRGECGASTVKCNVWSGKCEVQSVEYKVYNGKCSVLCGVWTIKWKM